MRPGQVLWGWPHCVQDPELTQLAIDRELTLIAFEAMNHWTVDGRFGLHVFHKNNELAGYCSVLQAMELVGITGTYGRRLSAVVIGFGATARGAVTALNAHGVSEVAVLTNRGVAAVGSPIHSVRIRQFDRDPDDPSVSHVITDRGREPLAAYLAENDIVVNCTLQDPAAPLTYLRTEDLAAFRQGSLIVDVSCDEGMGFSWAVPTTFDEPMFDVADRMHYYAVDHSPSYLWNSATWENSEALLPFVGTVMSGPDAWDGNETDQPRHRDPGRPHPEPRHPVLPGTCRRSTPTRSGRGSLRVLPRLREEGTGVGQQLGQRLRRTDHGDEVGVPGPARDDVLVEVVGQRPPGRSAQVDAHVERVRVADAADGADRALGHGHQLARLLHRQVLEVRDVAVGSTIRWPGLYGCRLSTAYVASPRATTRLSSSSPSGIRQNGHPSAVVSERT